MPQTDVERTLRPEPVPELTPVERMREGGSERRGFRGLDRNERTEPLPDWFIDDLRRSIDSALLTDYPSVDELHAELAQSTGLPPEQLLVTPGNDPAIKAVYQAYVRPGDTVAMLDPSYAMYAVYAPMFGAKVVGVPFDEHLQPDLEQLLETAAAPGTRVVFIANPNQPTGTILDEGALREIASAAGKSGALVFIDEAYASFARITALNLARELPNVLVAHSFSKAGFAGIRIGFVAGDPEIIKTLIKVRSAAEVNAVAILCARKLLAHPEIAEDFAAQVDAGKAALTARVEALGLTALPTHANFLQIRLNGLGEPRDVVDRLRAEGWLIKGPFSTPGLAGCVRVTLGGPALMNEFADALDSVLE